MGRGTLVWAIGCLVGLVALAVWLYGQFTDGSDRDVYEDAEGKHLQRPISAIYVKHGQGRGTASYKQALTLLSLSDQGTQNILLRGLPA